MIEYHDSEFISKCHKSYSISVVKLFKLYFYCTLLYIYQQLISFAIVLPNCLALLVHYGATYSLLILTNLNNFVLSTNVTIWFLAHFSIPLKYIKNKCPFIDLLGIPLLATFHAENVIPIVNFVLLTYTFPEKNNVYIFRQISRTNRLKCMCYILGSYDKIQTPDFLIDFYHN